MKEITTAKSLTPCANHLLKQLQEEFRVIGEYLPLAIGIDKQLLESWPEVNRRQLRTALGKHTHSVRYLKSMQAATHRFNLDGIAVGEVNEEQRVWASQNLLERLKRHSRNHQIAQVKKDQAENDLLIERERLRKLHELVGRFSLK